jgi:5-methylcytosine-specific restriction endonuclease McrA
MNHLTLEFLTVLEKKSQSFENETLDKLKQTDFEVGVYEGGNTLYIKDKDTFLFSDLFIPMSHCDYTYMFSENLYKICKEVQSERRLKYNYTAQLTHPLWKKRRLEIIEKSGKKCSRCGSKEHLQVHHKEYQKGKLAWEYEDDLLECLCGSCHKLHHKDDIKKDKDIDLWIKNNSLTKEESKKISQNKTFVLNYFNNEVVNKIVNSFELLSSSDNNIRFKVDNKKYYKYLYSLFGECIFGAQGSIGFSIYEMKKNKVKKFSKNE